MPHPELPPLPTHDDYYDAALRLDQIFAENDGVATFLKAYTEVQTDRSQEMRDFVANMINYGIFVDPTDRSTDQFFDEEHSTTVSIGRGAIAGLVLTRKVHNGFVSVFDAMGQVRFSPPQDTSVQSEIKNAIAGQIVRKGWQGMDLLGSRTARLVESWEDQLIDSRDPQMFRVGTGLVVLAAADFHKQMLMQAELARLVEDLDGGGEINWEGEFSALMSDPDRFADPGNS